MKKNSLIIISILLLSLNLNAQSSEDCGCPLGGTKSSLVASGKEFGPNYKEFPDRIEMTEPEIKVTQKYYFTNNICCKWIVIVNDLERADNIAFSLYNWGFVDSNDAAGVKKYTEGWKETRKDFFEIVTLECTQTKYIYATREIKPNGQNVFTVVYKK